MFSHQGQHEQQSFRCPGCGRTSETNVFIPDGAGISACPSCGLTAEEGQRKLNDELAAMFSRGMRLDGREMPPQPIITSATLTAIGGGVLSAGATPAPSALGYNSSQHYHHSAHLSSISAAAAGGALPRPNSAPGFVEGNAAASSSGGQDGDMDMDGGNTATISQHHDAEPYMKSGYEYLAERDYNRGGGRDQADQPAALSSKEWWREFHQPIEFQYGVYQQMRDRENEMPASAQEDEHMRLW